jgi:HEAT repeat protein
MSNDTEILQLVEQLKNKGSAKRRSAAKKLRKLKANKAGPALFEALKHELEDKRTWETQYQMIMALGESEHTDSFEFLTDLAEKKFEATIIYVAIGDAITRLTYSSTGSIHRIIKYLDSKNYDPLFIDGLIRAIAILKIVPNENDIRRFVNYATSPETSVNNLTWIASAAAGWKGIEVENFLNWCQKSENLQTKRAAEAALNNKYLKWSIL